MSVNSKVSKNIYNWTFLAIVVVGLIIVNVISAFVYTRIDMTADQRYSLNDGTKEFLSNTENFDNRLNITIYLEGNMPAEIKSFKNAIEDKLQEFKEFAGKRIEYQFVNPNVGTEGEQQELFDQLYAKGKGILPMDIVYEKDGEQSQMMLWPGATIDYGGSMVNTIQFLPGTMPGKPYNLNGMTEMIQNSLNNLEYILLSSIRRAVQKEKKRIGFLQGHGELTFAQTQRVRHLISPYYSVSDISLNDSVAALDSYDGLIIAGPTSKFSDKDLFLIDQFVMRGGRLFCFVDALTLSEDTLNAKGVTHTTRNSTGLEKLLFDYGLKMNDNYVIDVRCAPKKVPFAKQSLIPWFFHVLASPTSHPISRNVEPVSLKYVSEIQFVESVNARLTPVLTSSTNSNITGLAPMVSLGMPLNYGNNPELNPDPTNEYNKRCLAGLSEGYFKSHFKNRIVDEYANNPDSKIKDSSSVEGKVFLIANSRCIANSYDSMPNKTGEGFMYRPIEINELRMDPELSALRIPVFFGNQEFFQNAVDYVMGDNSVLDIRSKQIDINELDKEKIKAKAGMFKTINMILPSSLILLLAMAILYLRKKKYTKA